MAPSKERIEAENTKMINDILNKIKEKKKWENEIH
jgi:hypothetical protein